MESWGEDGREKVGRTRDLDTVDRTVSGHLEEGEELGIQRVEGTVDGGAVDSGRDEGVGGDGGRIG